MSKGRILIVDDDVSMTQSVACRLRNEGLDVTCVAGGRDALAHVQETQPDVILLELWLSGQDGLEILRGLKRTAADAAVIMMSGQGDIATAVKATQLGAVDFLEKPCPPERVLDTVHHLLQARYGLDCDPLSPRRAVEGQPGACAATRARHNPASQLTRPHCAAPAQRTLERSAVLRGHGLLSGRNTGLILSPLEPGRGIVFRNILTGDTMTSDIDHVVSTDFCTSLRCGPVAANTIEHLMSALHAYQISNAVVTLNGEIPIMDGSAQPFCELIETAGVVEQDEPVNYFTVQERYHVGEVSLDTKYIEVVPYDGFRVTYRVNYPPPIGIQEWTYEHCDGDGYRRELAPARTFAFVQDVEAMHDADMIPGARFTNAILIGDGNILNRVPMRFENEFVRHKILDIFGDMYLLGGPIRAHITANMTGHTENVEMVRALQSMIAVA